MLFGNDPKGEPRGSEAIGGPSTEVPLAGALLFGNDPLGDPRGAALFGSAESKVPLKGALLFGNDPQGNPRGSEAFGGADQALGYRGSLAFGAPQLPRERSSKETLTYDFAGTMLQESHEGLAAIRKHPQDRLRRRVCDVLRRRIAAEPERLRHGLGEDAIPWRKLRRENLDWLLAQALAKAYRLAPGEVLGVGQVRDLLEQAERMHTCHIHCEWNVGPLQFRVMQGKKLVAQAQSRLHNEHRFFVFSDPEGTLLGHVDSLVPNQLGQRARIRDAAGQVVAVFVLEEPNASADPELGRRFQGRVALADRDLFSFEEERVGPTLFRALVRAPRDQALVGVIEDRPTTPKVGTLVELDLFVPRLLVWASGLLLSDLARLRCRGWPA